MDCGVWMPSSNCAAVKFVGGRGLAGRTGQAAGLGARVRLLCPTPVGCAFDCALPLVVSCFSMYLPLVCVSPSPARLPCLQVGPRLAVWHQVSAAAERLGRKRGVEQRQQEPAASDWPAPIVARHHASHSKAVDGGHGLSLAAAAPHALPPSPYPLYLPATSPDSPPPPHCVLLAVFFWCAAPPTC